MMNRLRRFERVCLAQSRAMAVGIGAGVAVMTVALGAANLSAQQAYPVWWSPRLGLERLEDLDTHLTKTFWPEGGLKAYETHKADSPFIVVEDCDTLALAIAERRWAGPGVMVQSSWLIECRMLERLRDARPATVSYLRDFVLTDNAVDHLPAMLVSQPSCDAQCRIVAASGLGRTIGQYEANIVFVDAISQESLEIRTYYEWIYIDILARGDFTADGIDDMLVRAKVAGVDSRWGATDLFVLSRDTADGLIRVVDPEAYLCLDYRC